MKRVLNFPKMAVLIAAYNGKSCLHVQVDSILKQQGVDVTLFASVDISTDGTEDWFDHIAEFDNRVIVLPHGHHFGGAAPNFFRLIRDVDFEPFDYVCFADQDDIWHLDKLYRAMEQLRLHGADAYSSNVIAFWSSGKERLVCKSQPQQTWDYLFEAAGPGCTHVYKKALMMEIKNCVLANWESIQRVKLHDWFCYAFARAHCYHWYIDPHPSMLYRQHGGNQVGANNGIKAFLYRFREIVSGRGIEQSALIAQLVGKGDTDFVLMWAGFKRRGFFRLAFSANDCRRKQQDKFLFFCACLFMAAMGKE